MQMMYLLAEEKMKYPNP